MFCSQRLTTSNATSVLPNIVALDGLSPATNEHSLFLLAQKVGPVQVTFLFAAAYCLFQPAVSLHCTHSLHGCRLYNVWGRADLHVPKEPKNYMRRVHMVASWQTQLNCESFYAPVTRGIYIYECSYLQQVIVLVYWWRYFVRHLAYLVKNPLSAQFAVTATTLAVCFRHRRRTG